MKDLIIYLKENNVEESQHLDKFISFLKENAKPGELKSNNKSYLDYFDKCDPFYNVKFSQNIDNSSWAEDYCEEHDIDSIYDDEENFIKYVKDIVNDQLELDLERGLIKIERVIDVTSSFSKYKGNIGIYWTYIEGFGDSYGAYSYKNNITICALVDPKDVNWEETIAANLIDPEEYELTLKENAPIQITKILGKDRQKTILKENLLYNA